MNIEERIKQFEEEVGIKIEKYTIKQFATIGSILRIKGGNYMLCQVADPERLKLISLDAEDRGNRYVDTEFEGVYKEGTVEFDERWQFGIYIDTLRDAGFPAEYSLTQRIILEEGSR